MEPVLPILVWLGAFVSVSLLGASAWALGAPAEGLEGEAAPSAVHADIGPPRFMSSLGALAMPEDPTEREALDAWLAQAGYRDRFALPRYLAWRVGLTVVLPLALASVLSTEARGYPVLLLLAAAAGYFVPRLWVGAMRRARQRRLQLAVPNMLDMLVSCMEAGLGTDAALQYVAREIRVASADLADELESANAAMTAGLSRSEALRQLDRRTGIDELTALVSVLGQAERFGAGVAPSVRAHAQLARRRRVLEAEQRAAQASPWLTIVMVVFILPALFVVLIGPTVVNVVHNFLPSLHAGLR